MASYPGPVTAVVAGPAAALYSSGGGGVVLEHQYGATLLASLLTADPLPELGDDVTPMAIRFQASAVSAVDDLLISGRTPDGGTRQGLGRRQAGAEADQERGQVQAR